MEFDVQISDPPLNPDSWELHILSLSHSWKYHIAMGAGLLHNDSL